MHTITGRRIAGWIILSPAIVIGALGLGGMVSGCQPSVVPAGSADQSATPAPSAGASVAPRESDAPEVGATIPPFVPVPSGPNP